MSPGKDAMTDPDALAEAGYILYSDLMERLRQRFPDTPSWRLEQIVAAENEAITGGVLRIVPSEVEAGATEVLERSHQHEGEVA